MSAHRFERARSPRGHQTRLAFADLLRKRHPGPRTAALSVVLHRGVVGGQLRPDLELGIMRDLTFGPPICRLLITGRPISKRALQASFGPAWSAIAAQPLA